jgi:hypothetical protein
MDEHTTPQRTHEFTDGIRVESHDDASRVYDGSFLVKTLRTRDEAMDYARKLVHRKHSAKR